MIGMAGLPMTIASIRGQIASAIRVIVQLSRLSDGKRRVMSIAEITGMEGDIIQMQEIYKFVRTATLEDGTVAGPFHGDRHPAALPHRSRRQGHQDSGQLLRPEPAAVTRPHAIRSRSDICGLRLRGGLGHPVRRGRLSAVLLGGVLSQPHQSPSGAAQRHGRPPEHPGAAAPRARAHHGRRLPAAGAVAQSPDRAVRASGSVSRASASSPPSRRSSRSSR